MTKSKLVLALFIISTAFSKAIATNLCFERVYRPINANLADSPYALKLNLILQLNDNEIKQAKIRLSDSAKAKQPEPKPKKNEEVKTSFDEILFTEEQAKIWIKELIKGKFLLGSFHESIWLYSAYQALNLKKPIPFAKVSVGHAHVDVQTLKPIYEAFDIKSEANQAAVSAIPVLEKNFYKVQLELHNWKSLSSGDRQKVYEEDFRALFHEDVISRDGFFSQMDLLSSIASTREGDSFLNFILNRSGPEMVKSLKKNRSGFGEKSVVALSTLGMGLGTFLYGDVGLGQAVLLGGGAFIGSALPALWVKGTKLSRFKGIASRFKSRRQLIDSLGESTFQQKVDTAEKEIAKLDQEEIADDFSFALIKKELDRGLQDNPILVPAWGHHLSSGIQTLIGRNKKLKQRYDLIVKDADQILKKLSEKDETTTDQIQTDALQKINSVSREDLVNVLIDFHSIKMDYLALALSLDRYMLALEKLSQSPEINQAHQKIIDDKLTGLRQFAGILEIAATKLNTQSALVISTAQSINELDTSLHIERLQGLLND